jgi:hypothetical protein
MSEGEEQAMKLVVTILAVALVAVGIAWGATAASGSTEAAVSAPVVQSATTVMGMQAGPAEAPTVSIPHNIPESGLEPTAAAAEVQQPQIEDLPHNIPAY